MNVMDSILVPALEEAKATMKKGAELQPDPNLVLMGNGSAFDSLAFVSFIVVVEEQIYNVTGKTIALVDDKAFSGRNSPFKTLGTLCSYIQERIENEPSA